MKAYSLSDTPLYYKRKNETYDELYLALGEADADMVAERLGGINIHIPHDPTKGCRLFKSLTPSARERLSDYFGGADIRLPALKILKRQFKSRALALSAEAALEEGKTIREVAMEHGVSDRWIYKILADLRGVGHAHA